MPQVNFTIDFWGARRQTYQLATAKDCPLDVPLKDMAHVRGFQSLTSNIHDNTEHNIITDGKQAVLETTTTILFIYLIAMILNSLFIGSLTHCMFLCWEMEVLAASLNGCQKLYLSRF